MRWFSTLTKAVGFLALGPSLLAFLGGNGWPFFLWEQLRPPFALVLVAAAAVAGWERSWRWMGLWLAGAAVNLALLVPLFLPWHGADGADPAAGPPGPELRLLHANVQVTHAEPDRLLDWIDRQECDLVLLHEFTPAWRRRVEARAGPYRLALAMQRAEPSGIAVLVPSEAPRWEVRSARSLQMSMIWGERPVAEVVLARDGFEIAILGLHAARPVSRWESVVQEQDDRFATAWATEQRRAGRRAILIGDFNATPWSSRFRHLLAAGGLRDTLRGRGYQGSWPASAPAILRLPIDHALVSDRLRVLSRHLGPDLGSDHLPLLLTLHPN